MKENCQCRCTELLSKVLRKLELLEPKINYQPVDEFDIETIEKASQKLSCSVSTVKRAISDGRLEIDVHYKYNGRKKYLFSTFQLIQIKGKF